MNKLTPVALLWVTTLVTDGCTSHENEYTACHQTLTEFIAAATRDDASAAAKLINATWTREFNTTPAGAAKHLMPFAKDASAKRTRALMQGKVIRIYYSVTYSNGSNRSFWVSFAQESAEWRIINIREFEGRNE